MSKKKYPLDPCSIGEDTYIVISKGHHDIHEFMRKVREEVSEFWPLGVPEHIWIKTVPAPKNSEYTCWFEPVEKGTRGAWPCTYVQEAYGEDRYEVRYPNEVKKQEWGDHD